MIRLKHCLMAIGGLVMLIAAVARLNALDTDAQNPPGHEVAVVHALFNLQQPETTPFPSDVFTVVDHTHNTGRRVNLPYPDCTVHVSDCEDLDVINTLDGFGLQTRISIPFDGPIDANTATKETVFLIRLGSTLRRGHDHHSDDDINNLVRVIGINQVVWDVPTNTLHVESDELLAQHTRYALIVTDGLRDDAGRPIGAATAFRRFRQTARGDYKHALLEAIHAARRLGVRERNIVTASVYTTQSITSVMERIRDQIKAGTPAPANFALGPTGERAVFKLPDVASISWAQHTGINPDAFRAMSIDLAVLQVVPGAVGTIAYARYVSPDYNVHPGEYIPAVGTRTGTPLVRGYNDIYFTLYLPSGPRPAAGWPIALVGGGTSGNQHFTSGNFASKFAANGIATIGINHMGQGFGPLGALRVNMKDGASLTIPDAGRGIDQNGDHVITNTEGSEAAGRWSWTTSSRDAHRQTVIDLMQLVRVIEVGMDVDGDDVVDVDPSRIHFVGASAGSMIGTVFMALEPSVPVGVLAATPGVIPEHARWQPNRRPQIGAALQTRTPSLINSLGLTEIDGVRSRGPISTRTSRCGTFLPSSTPSKVRSRSRRLWSFLRWCRSQVSHRWCGRAIFANDLCQGCIPSRSSTNSQPAISRQSTQARRRSFAQETWRIGRSTIATIWRSRRIPPCPRIRMSLLVRRRIPTRCSDRSRAERRIRSRYFSPLAVPSSFIRSPHNSLRCRSTVHCRRN